MNKVVFTEEAPSAIGPYSQAYLAKHTLYISGQLGIDPVTGELVEGVEAQCQQSCENIGKILAEAKMGFEDVVKTTCFIADMDDFAAFNEVYSKYFISKPARSCVAVKQLPKNGLCEIETIAYKKKK